MSAEECSQCHRSAPATTEGGTPLKRFMVCPLCLSYFGVRTPFCSDVCYKAAWKTHKKLMHAVSGFRSVSPDTFPLFITPASRISITTPRLLLRAVTQEDLYRVFDVKRERAVSRTQLYGTPTRLGDIQGMHEGYVLNSIPAVASTGSRIPYSRTRYVFAITPRRNEAGELLLRAKESPEDITPLNENGYIGNIAVELDGSDVRYGARSGKVFRHPSAAELKDSSGNLFYEIHPSYWNQGVMTETLTHVIRYAFDVLRLGSVLIDPVVGNEASTKLAKSFGQFVRTQANPHRRSVQQDIYIVQREAWYEGEKKREGGTKEEPKEELEAKACRWCMRADSNALVKCARCDWGWYCTSACRNADAVYVQGHTRSCPL